MFKKKPPPPPQTPPLEPRREPKPLTEDERAALSEEFPEVDRELEELKQAQAARAEAPVLLACAVDGNRCPPGPCPVCGNQVGRRHLDRKSEVDDG